LFGICCHFVCPRPVLLRSQSTATHLYRIAQEAVGNAIKHGGGTRVTIDLRHAGRGHLSLSIRDDGGGIVPGEPGKSGMGFQIMRYRASMCGGTLEIGKALPRGALITCRVPVSGRKGGA
jgi:signal transduction histidine kinase